ncbi:MAG: hypothetical protein JWO17_1967 [Actinomycetia bacterium]|nr:hypothetical protein [Actinomycetes bacterium]
MANSFFRRRTLVLLALVVISVIAGKAGLQVPGFWDGPR